MGPVEPSPAPKQSPRLSQKAISKASPGKTVLQP
jgi:hypothetical protein